MIQFLRHTAVCLWLTLLIGGMGSLWLLPMLQTVLGIHAMPFLVAGGLAVLFVLVAWAANRIGLSRVTGLMRAADVAERDGLPAEAEGSFREALAALDRFWVSPSDRRKVIISLAGRLARFYLAQARLGPAAEDFITQYLSLRPGDAEVAEQWVRQAEGRGGIREEYQDLADRLGSAHPRNDAIQRALARLYLTLERTDYPALRSYRRVCDSQGRAPIEFCGDLARLLRKERRFDEWAQQIYSQAQAAAPASDRSAFHPPLDVNRFEADDFEPLRSQVPPSSDEWDPSEGAFRMADEAEVAEEELEERTSLLSGHPEIRPSLLRLANVAGSVLHIAWEEVDRIARGLGKLFRLAFRYRSVRLALAVLLVAGLAAGGLWWSIDTLNRFDREASGPAGIQRPAPAAVTGSDPYTLQVAAYLKQEYAFKLVEELKRKGLDAYWTETSSGGKLWYQVRVSHFPDQQSARNYGRDLKWKGLIDDFYVTNYVR